jgi:glycosyltransferase involved in cell wall biosynthesis
VIHLNGYAHGSLPWQAPAVVVAHSCVLSWWQDVRGGEIPAQWNTYQQAIMQGLHAAACVVAPTEAMLRSLCEHYGSLSNAGVIYNGRDFARFAPGDKARFIFSAGRLWDEAKNVAALQQIAPELAWPVYVAGEARHPEAAHNGAAPTQSNNLHPLGRLDADDMTTWLGSASIYCLPARYEPFGLSALEAALCGCALVLGDIPSLREVWRDAAVFVDPDDTAALTATLNALSEDDARRTQLGARARERALTFGAARMGDEYAALYRELCAAQQGNGKAHVLAA